jgi:hypothetical protein
MKRGLWEILVPVRDNRDKKIAVRFHQGWDAKVREISGGLTIRKPERGQWVHPESKALFAERMIPVKFMGTRDEAERITEMTLDYYDQEAVMCYKIAEEVIMKVRK